MLRWTEGYETLWTESITSSLKLNWDSEIKFSLVRRRLNWDDESGFVRVSATCIEYGMYLGSISLLSTFSLRKCMSISTCFVREWRTRFFVKQFALILSNHIMQEGGIGWCSYLSSEFTHKMSAVAIVIALYSAFILEQATTCCVRAPVA